MKNSKEDKESRKESKTDMKQEEKREARSNLDRKQLMEYLRIGLIIFLSFILIVAIWSLYVSLNELVSIWINYKYAPIYRAILNAGVIAVVFFILKRAVEVSRRQT
jgi:uncharacterized membrane protein